MLTRRLPSIWLGVLLCASALFAASCEKVPLLAPTGSTITLNAATNVVAANGATQIIAQVLEAAGTPPHSGTRVTFTTSLGRVDPPSVETDASGTAIASFIANGANGTATISANSGGASTGATGALKLSVGSAAVGRIGLNATPSTLPANGGVTTVTAIVLDINGNALGGTPVVFSTSAGTLSTSLIATDNNGIANTVLTTAQTATVTASVGASAPSTTTPPSTGTGGTTATGTQTATLQIPLTPAPTILITGPTTAPSRGLPASFSFAVTPAAQGGAPIRSVVVNWGDGGIEDLGSFTGTQTAFHVFNSEGTFRISATVTDVAGGSNSTSTSVVIVPAQTPTVLITPSVPDQCSTTCTVTFTLQVTPPSGIGIISADITFGADATPRSTSLGSLVGTAIVTARYPAAAGPQTIELTVVDTLGRTTKGITVISLP